MVIFPVLFNWLAGIWIAVIIFGGGWVFLRYLAEKQDERTIMWGYIYLINLWLFPFFILTLVGALLITGWYELYMRVISKWVGWVER